ncbi:MAG: hypothetical protein EOO81_02160 [Oxalobacteraceae bacterium]|nr:MAG: hypothetical protein EOO81_02160 [Oxalobacteraceae bacterium]
MRATICALLDHEGDLQAAEAWLAAHTPALTFVPEPDGCGCCVISWDVEGPDAVIATIPQHLLAGSSWASPAEA